jgi:hypothetical protein
VERLPVPVLAVIRTGDGFWSEHAAESRDRLGLEWNDIAAVASEPESVRKESDKHAVGGYKYVLVGRDSQDRRLYPVGKVVAYGDDKYWRVITVHEAD